jgi:cysteine desulfurase/selenocysteine lyase
VGREKTIAHEHFLRKTMEEQLLKMDRLRILGECQNKGPITTFAIEGVHPLDLATLLDLKNIAIRSGHLCAQPCLKSFGLEAAARVSFGIYNTVEEVHRFLDELKKILKKI